MPKTSPPVTFVCCLSGSIIDRARLLRTLASAMRHDDHGFAIDGNYGPANSAPADGLPGGLQMLRLADAPLALAYDLVAKEAAHEHLIFVGTGCSISRPDMDKLRSVLVAAAPGAAVFVPYRTGTTVSLDARSIFGVSRSVIKTLGGMAPTEDRARRVNAGFVGSADLFEVFLHEVRRGGWRVEHVRQNTPSREVSPPSDPMVGLPEPEGDGPPSRRISPELKAAVGADAEATARWFSTFLPEAQIDALSALLRSPGRRSAADGDQGWDVLAVARMLWWRGQRPYAAHLLEQTDLTRYTDGSHLGDIFLILTTGGRPIATAMNKLSHARSQLPAVIAAQPVDQASKILLDWWEATPGAEEVVTGVLLVAPALSLIDAADWHARLLAMPSSSSPLVAVARNAGRPLKERAVAARCLEIADPGCIDPELEALVASVSPSEQPEVDRAARALMADTTLTAAIR